MNRVGQKLLILSVLLVSLKFKVFFYSENLGESSKGHRIDPHGIQSKM